MLRWPSIAVVAAILPAALGPIHPLDDANGAAAEENATHDGGGMAAGPNGTHRAWDGTVIATTTTTTKTTKTTTVMVMVAIGFILEDDTVSR